MNGVDFSKIASIQAAGNSNELRNYRYTDTDIQSEKNYYRLRSVDLDNDSELSDIVLVKIPGAGQKIFVVGNPFSDKIVLRLFKESVSGIQLRLVDVSGRTIRQKQYGKGMQVIEWQVGTEKLASGVYFLHVVVDGITHNHKLLKQ